MAPFLIEELHKKYSGTQVYIKDRNTGEFFLQKLNFSTEKTHVSISQVGYTPVSEIEFKNILCDDKQFVNNSKMRRALLMSKSAPRTSTKGVSPATYLFSSANWYVQLSNENHPFPFDDVVSDLQWKMYPGHIDNYYINLWNSFAISPELVFCKRNLSGEMIKPLDKWTFHLYFYKTYLGSYNFFNQRWLTEKKEFAGALEIASIRSTLVNLRLLR